mmetsp:Transcript_35040/g.91847  ORF Transcript_35040/g.91847 Transcript_35040/m.91847 type:complete len:224 (-) Transcript_35040:133-804(-)
MAGTARRAPASARVSRWHAVSRCCRRVVGGPGERRDGHDRQVGCERGFAYPPAVRPHAVARRRVARGGAARRCDAAQAGCTRTCPRARAQGTRRVPAACDSGRCERVCPLLVGGGAAGRRGPGQLCRRQLVPGCAQHMSARAGRDCGERTVGRVGRGWDGGAWRGERADGSLGGGVGLWAHQAGTGAGSAGGGRQAGGTLCARCGAGDVEPLSGQRCGSAVAA